MKKKAEVLLGAIVIVILVLIFIAWLVNEGWKECKNDSDCGTDQYCSSGFECKQIPIIEKTIQSTNYEMFAFIIALGLIAFAIYIKLGLGSPPTKQVIREVVTVKEKPEIKEVYSTPQGSKYHLLHCITLSGKKELRRYIDIQTASNMDLKPCHVCLSEEKS